MWFFSSNKKRAFIQALGKDHPKTPDLAQLEDKRNHLLFVCDDMMRPHQNYEHLQDCSRLAGRGFTRHHFDYRVTKHSGKGLPLPSRNGLRIKGELHLVDTPAFKALDNHYQNGIEFVRMSLQVIVTHADHQLITIGEERKLRDLPPGKITTKHELGIRHYVSDTSADLVHAFMYVAKAEHWVDQDKGGFSYPSAEVCFPKNPPHWLPKYYKYPINRNRCLK